MFALVNAWPMNAVCTALLAKSSEFSIPSRFAPLLGTPLLGTPLLGTPLLGTPLLGTPLLGTPLLGVPAVVKTKSDANPAARSDWITNCFMGPPRQTLYSLAGGWVASRAARARALRGRMIG